LLEIMNSKKMLRARERLNKNPNAAAWMFRKDPDLKRMFTKLEEAVHTNLPDNNAA